jgi:SNF2 family DNA or RNA helicase
MPLEIPTEVVRPPRKSKAKKPKPIDPRVLNHPRVIHPKVTGEEFLALKPRGILTFDPKYTPSKFRLYSEYARRDDAARIPFAGWSGKKKCWILPISIETLRWMSHFFPGFLMTPDAFKIACRIKKAAKVEAKLLGMLQKIKQEKIDCSRIKGHGELQPRHEQQVCIAYQEMAWDKGYGAGNFVEQGLGKTCIALILMDRILERDPDAKFVVFAPKGILYTTWVTDTLKFTKNIRPFVPTGSIPKRGERCLYARQYDWAEHYEQDGMPRTRFVRRTGQPNMFLVNHEVGRTRQKDDPKTHNDLILALQKILKDASKNSAVVIDEVDKFSNSQAKQSKAAKFVTSVVSRTLPMTGTPGMPEKYFGILHLIDEKVYNVNKTDFYHRYVEQIDLGDRSKITGYKRLTELHRRTDQFSIRYKQEDCANIPPWTRVEVEVELSAEQQKAYEEVAAMIESYYEDHDITKTSLGAKLHGLRNITGGFVKDAEGEYIRFRSNGKLSALIADLEDELAFTLTHPEQVRKAFIVVQYKEDIEIITDAIDKKRRSKKEADQHWSDYGYTIVSGDIVDKGEKLTRTNNILAFRQDPNTRILIATEAAISHGHHLVPELPMVCDVGYIYSSGYCPNRRDQVTKRIIRSGQTRMVRFKEFLAKGTIDETIADAIQAKLNVCGIVNGDNMRRLLRGRGAA